MCIRNNLVYEVSYEAIFNASIVIPEWLKQYSH